MKEENQIPIDFSKPVIDKCPHCGASMKAYWHSLTPGLVKTFKKFVDTVKKKGINDVHLQGDMDLTKNEYNNFQKLRYWGLVHHVKGTKHKTGHWLITRQGGEFLRGEKPMPRKIKTFRNKIEEKSEDVIWIFDFYKSVSKTYWQTEYDIEIFQGKLI